MPWPRTAISGKRLRTTAKPSSSTPPAPAYNSRALVFVSQGDYTRAVADVTKAGELASKKGQLVNSKAPLRAKPKIYVGPTRKRKTRRGPRQS